MGASALRLESIDQSQSTAHRSMLECVYVWQKPRLEILYKRQRPQTISSEHICDKN